MAVIKGHNCKTVPATAEYVWWTLEVTSELEDNFGKIHLLKGNKFATGAKIKAAGESKLNDCPGHVVHSSTVFKYKL